MIVDALCAEPDVSVFSLGGVAAGCPDLLVGIRGVTHLVEVKDGAKPPSRRTFTPDQRRWIERWHGAPVVVLTDEETARAWVQHERMPLREDEMECGHRPMSAFKNGAQWRCSGCGQVAVWSDAWSYFGAFGCRTCGQEPVIKFVACSDTCRAQLERASAGGRHEVER